MFDRKFFVLTHNYHGATLLSKLLHSHPRAVCLADTYPSNCFDQICGCGEMVSKCQFWRQIKEQVQADRYLDLPSLLPLHPRFWGDSIDRRLFDRLPIPVLKKIMPTDRAAAFAADYRRFLLAVYAQFERREPTVFVDGVKSTGRVKALICSNERIDGVLHVVRDPADFVKSTMSKIGGGLWNLASAARSWRREHGRIEALRSFVPYLRIEYESLCNDLDATLRGIFQFVGLRPMTLDELHRQPAQPWHFMGNSSMFGFDWRIVAQRYPLSGFERLMINKIAGPTKR